MTIKNNFIIFPAIDMKAGMVVRLYQGDMARATHYGNNILAQAQEFYRAGARALHLVNLDGAVSDDGTGDMVAKNYQAVKDIALWRNHHARDMMVQLGGGIRNQQALRQWLQLGLDRLVVGTWAVKATKDVKKLLQADKNLGKKIILAVDCKNGMVMTHGWVKESKMKALDFIRAITDDGAIGLAGIVYTDIARDGTGAGSNIIETEKLVVAMAKHNILSPVIVSGGVDGMDEVARLRQKKIFGGVIIGRAIYDKKIDLQQLFSRQ